MDDPATLLIAVPTGYLGSINEIACHTITRNGGESANTS